MSLTIKILTEDTLDIITIVVLHQETSFINTIEQSRNNVQEDPRGVASSKFMVLYLS